LLPFGPCRHGTPRAQPAHGALTSGRSAPRRRCRIRAMGRALTAGRRDCHLTVVAPGTFAGFVAGFKGSTRPGSARGAGLVAGRMGPMSIGSGLAASEADSTVTASDAEIAVLGGTIPRSATGMTGDPARRTT